jgi:parallel beta-helix repeat protein
MVSMLLIMVSCVPLADALHISRHDVAMPAGSWVCPDEPLAPQYTPTLFVATDGNDGNDGRSLGRPLRTLQRAADLAQPGDVIWVRGGTYTNPVHFRRSGTSSAPIVIESHPGECAILDGSHLSSGRPVTFASVQHLHFRNFVVRNSPTEGIYLDRSHDNRVTNVRTHHHYWSGITVAASNRNLFAYFISHDNFDPPAGGHADGINVNTGDRNHIDRCIVYNNSDDGVDTWRSTRTLVERCIAFDNGWQGGDGNGIKAGGGDRRVGTVVRHSIAFHNRVDGFDSNSGLETTFDHNTAFANGRLGFLAGGATLTRNLAIGNGEADYSDSRGPNSERGNSWNVRVDGWAFDDLTATDPTHSAFLMLREHVGLGALDPGQRLEDVFGLAWLEHRPGGRDAGSSR